MRSWSALGAPVLVALLGGAARAEEPLPPVTATMACEPVAQPGRVKCTAEVRVAGGRTLAWTDLVLVELPELAGALKGRIGPADATAHDATSTTWAFGLVAKKAGQGEARARVRAVVCEPAPAAPGDAGAPAPRCTSSAVDVRAALRVGG